MPPADGAQADGTSTTPNLSAQDREDLEAINSSIDRMRDFTPADPYIITIPQDVEPRYHHQYKHNAMQWLERTPFDRSEHESTQYQTFVFHEPGSGMYMLHNSRPPESEYGNGDMSVRGGREKAGTGANTPVGGQGAKKTMSFGAYKKQKTGGSLDSPARNDNEASTKKPAVKGPVERIKADEEVLAAVEEDLSVPAPSPEKKDLKRKRGNSLENIKQFGDLQEQPTESAEDHEPTTKKVRTKSASQEDAKQPEQSEESEQQVKPPRSPRKESSPAQPPEETHLPPKLTPPPATEEADLPPKLSPIDEIPSLPSRLSPTIPSNIKATLDARVHFRSASRSSDVSGPRSASKDANTRHFSPAPKPVPRNAFRANSSSPAVRSDGEDRGRTVTSMPPKVPEPDSQESDEIPVGKFAAKLKKQRETFPENPSLLVRLKFKKSQREAVKRLLKMRPDPAKTSVSSEPPQDESKADKVSAKPADSRHRERRDTNAKGVAHKVGPSTANGATKKKDSRPVSPERKRPRIEDDDEFKEPPPKRKKATSDPPNAKREDPSTPKQTSALSPSSAQKSNSQFTPGKALLSATMKRERSSDSNMNTPPAMSQNSPTANGVLVNGVSKAPSSQPSNKTPKQQAWESEQKRLETLGRELKHGASSHLKSLAVIQSDPSAPSNDQKLAAIKSIESLLAYILAFTCADEAARAADPKMNPSTKTWRSLHGFFGFVKRNCEQFPLLLGLTCWIGVVFTARVLDLTVQHLNEASNFNSVLETQAMMLRAANDAEYRLDVDTLQSAFPKSWEGRTKGAIPAQSPEVGKSFAGAYKLPLGLQSSPLRAARAGYAMLEEWIGKEGGAELYSMKLKL